MKTVILAGGLGTRLSEETALRPKPMVEVGGKPLLWHIMNIYAAHGFNEFVLALGYKGEVIKEYFLDFFALDNDLTINLATGEHEVHAQSAIDWVVHLVYTGLHTQTGGRLHRLAPWVGSETFMMTYGDGVADIPVADLVAFHHSHGKLATVTAVRPPARFGNLALDNGEVSAFLEKPQAAAGWINGGFFVLEPGVFDYLKDDQSVWERDPMERLARDGQLMAYEHPSFWQPMDTLRDRNTLENLWATGEAPWKVW